MRRTFITTMRIRLHVVFEKEHYGLERSIAVSEVDVLLVGQVEESL